jgi:hypothetical protein
MSASWMIIFAEMSLSSVYWRTVGQLIHKGIETCWRMNVHLRHLTASARGRLHRPRSDGRSLYPKGGSS